MKEHRPKESDILISNWQGLYSEMEGELVSIDRSPFKGTVSWDFFAQLFFFYQFILVPIEMSLGCFSFLRFHLVIALLKWLPGTLETGELQLPGTLETGESQLPGFQSTRELHICKTLKTPQYFGNRGVATPRFPKHQGVVTFRPRSWHESVMGQFLSYSFETFTDCRPFSCLQDVKI